MAAGKWEGPGGHVAETPSPGPLPALRAIQPAPPTPTLLQREQPKAEWQKDGMAKRQKDGMADGGKTGCQKGKAAGQQNVKKAKWRKDGMAKRQKGIVEEKAERQKGKGGRGASRFVWGQQYVVVPGRRQARAADHTVAHPQLVEDLLRIRLPPSPPSPSPTPHHHPPPPPQPLHREAGSREEGVLTLISLVSFSSWICSM